MLALTTLMLHTFIADVFSRAAVILALKTGTFWRYFPKHTHTHSHKADTEAFDTILTGLKKIGEKRQAGGVS